MRYRHAFTYDILPASDTGAYFAGGALVGSTLACGAGEWHGRPPRLCAGARGVDCPRITYRLHAASTVAV